MIQELKNALKSHNFINIALLLFVCQISAGLISPFISVFLSQKIHANTSQIGLFVTLSSLSAMIISFILAQLSDKFGRRRFFIGIALISAVLGYFLFAITNRYLLILIVSISFIGISTTLTAQTFAYAKVLFHEDNNIDESSIALLRMVVSIAWVGSPVLGAYLEEYYGYSGLFIGCSFGYLIAFFILIILFRRGRKTILTDNYSNNETNVRIYNNFVIFMYFIVFTMLQSINTVLNTNIPLYITETLHYSNTYIGYISSFSAITEIPITIILVSLSRRIDIKKLINIGMIACLCFLGLLLLFKNIYLIIIIHIIKSVFVSAFMALGITFFQGMIPKRYGLSTVLYTNTTRTGNICAGIITGVSGNNYLNSFCILMVICIVSQIFFYITNALTHTTELTV